MKCRKYHKKACRSYEAAKRYVKQFKFSSKFEFFAYCRSGKMPSDIPGDPYSYYGKDFVGWGDFLGNGNVSIRYGERKPQKEVDIFPLPSRSVASSSIQNVCKKNPVKKRKWTHETRSIMYRSLYENFGPFSKWTSVDNPNGNKMDYDEWKKNMSKLLSLYNGREYNINCIEKQIEFAFRRNRAGFKKTLVPCFIHNVSVCLEIGLLSWNDMPEFMLLDYNPKLAETVYKMDS